MLEVISESCSPILTEGKRTVSEVKSESCPKTLAEVVLSKPPILIDADETVVQNKDMEVLVKDFLH